MKIDFSPGVGAAATAALTAAAALAGPAAPGARSEEKGAYSLSEDTRQQPQNTRKSNSSEALTWSGCDYENKSDGVWLQGGPR